MYFIVSSKSSKKTYSLMMAFVVFALIGICYAANWQQVITFTGSSSRTTDYFAIPTSEWRITLSYSPKAGSTYSGVAVYVTNRNGDLVTAIPSPEDQSVTTYIHEGPNDYYLDITSFSANYEIIIEYDAAATTSPSPSPTLTPSPTPSPTLTPSPTPTPTPTSTTSISTPTSTPAVTFPKEATYAIAATIIIIIIAAIAIILRTKRKQPTIQAPPPPPPLHMTIDKK